MHRALLFRGVGLLSNILGFRDGSWGAEKPAQIRLATSDEIEPALRLVLSPPGGTADAKGIADFIAFARERGMTFDALHVAERGGRLVSAILPVVSPGRTMLMLLPAGAIRGAELATGQLVDGVCAYAVERDVHLAQVLVDPADPATARMLDERGFERMAELYYLQQEVSGPAEPPALPDGMRWVTYSPQTHEAFGRAILASYEGSLDCPSLNGLRDIDDIIAGHKASGTFVPESWFLLYEGDAALGVLLLCESARGESVELVYLGLSPAARGRKLAEVLMRQAGACVAGRGMSRLYLAVDSRNVPALKLYYRHGMARVSSKVAMLKDLREVR
jgi:GNAT superfamily N-acetyltransferase